MHQTLKMSRGWYKDKEKPLTSLILKTAADDDNDDGRLNRGPEYAAHYETLGVPPTASYAEARSGADSNLAPTHHSTHPLSFFLSFQRSSASPICTAKTRTRWTTFQ